ncbi:alginate O-acetyltransferase AlgX-related protein [Desulforhopalus sp. 52FAK]
MGKEKLSREAIAHIEIGSTVVFKNTAWLLCAFFLVSIFSVPLIQYGVKSAGPVVSDAWSVAQVEPKEDDSLFNRIDQKNTYFLKGLDVLETRLEEESFLRSMFLPPLQSLLLNVLGQGNEKVVAGKGGWLFFRPGIDAITGQPFLDESQQQMRYEGHELWEKPVQPDPLLAITDFHRQLQDIGIELILVPVPIKPSIHAEKISSYDLKSPPNNRSWNDFLARLKENNITVFDGRSILTDYAKKHGQAYLTTDTHWLPGAMDYVAKTLATEIAVEFSDLTGTGDYIVQPTTLEGEGDVSRMLTLPATAPRHLQSVEIQQVMNRENELWQPERNAEILLLGDSFTNIYSTMSLGWGRSAGFAEHVSYYLKSPLDLIGKNDSGAYVTREILSQELARGRDRLAGKKLVIWEFAERELSLGDWKLIDLTLGSASENGFFAAEPGMSSHVEAVVGAISRSPRPGSVPYRDNILTIHLVDLKGEDVSLETDQALVYGLGMKDNQLTDMANLRPGDSVSMTLTAWEEVEGEYGSFRRSPLDDAMLELELPNWGVIKNEKN